MIAYTPQETLKSTVFCEERSHGVFPTSENRFCKFTKFVFVNLQKQNLLIYRKEDFTACCTHNHPTMDGASLSALADDSSFSVWSVPWCSCEDNTAELEFENKPCISAIPVLPAGTVPPVPARRYAHTCTKGEAGKRRAGRFSSRESRPQENHSRKSLRLAIPRCHRLLWSEPRL